MNRTFVWASAALLAVASLSGAAQAQVVVSTPVVATPQVVGVVPVRRGLFGLRTSYRPVYGTAVTPVQSTFYMPSSSVSPVQTSYYAPAATVAPIQTSFYAPAATAAPVQTTYYGATAAPRPVTTTRFSSEYSGSISSSHYAPAPTVTTNHLPTTTYYGGTSIATPTVTNYAPISTFYGPVTTPTTTYYAPMEAIVVP
ncbi:hypothetical protein [Blastopirellula retiformator]|uniref:Uncharacterized protein n=1 Tax=Blastopirellula retiformator TaxID=2527970 RepID=A0A5C5V2B5_9BACT|nr:hypothetical protein [Blastopirellula retiformator]TWT31862.1 hypothetical protein Enr8_37870 [Blastopirellula retiformator]